MCVCATQPEILAAAQRIGCVLAVEEVSLYTRSLYFVLFYIPLSIEHLYRQLVAHFYN